MGVVKNSKIIFYYQVPITWIYKLSSTLDLEIQLKCKLESHNSCILSILNSDRHTASRGTNLLSSPFDCRVNIKYFNDVLLDSLCTAAPHPPKGNRREKAVHRLSA